MTDLVVASMILGALALMALLFGLWLGRRGGSTLRTALEIAAVALLGVYFLLLWNQPVLVKLLPTSALIVLSNWLPLWGSFFVGIYAASDSIGYRRQVCHQFTDHLPRGIFNSCSGDWSCPDVH